MKSGYDERRSCADGIVGREVGGLPVLGCGAGACDGVLEENLEYIRDTAKEEDSPDKVEFRSWGRDVG